MKRMPAPACDAYRLPAASAARPCRCVKEAAVATPLALEATPLPASVVTAAADEQSEGDGEEERCGQERDRPETAVVRFGEGHARDRRGRPVVAVPQRAALFRRGAGACLGRDGALAFLAFFAGARAGVRSPKWAATCRR